MATGLKISTESLGSRFIAVRCELVGGKGMRSRSEIVMDYNRVMGLADQLDSLAGKLKQEMDGTVRGTLDSLRAAWQGENSGLFM